METVQVLYRVLLYKHLFIALGNMSEPFSEEAFVNSIFGPASAEFQKLKDSTQQVDVNEGVSIIPHLKWNGWVFTWMTLRGLYEWRNLDVQKDDIVVTSFPKTGTTWIQEIVYHVLHVDDIEKPSQKCIDERFPYMEMPDNAEVFKSIRELTKPRLLKSHLPFSLLPLGKCNKGYKIIYISRNPKDTAVSMYHFYRAIYSFGFQGTLLDFVNMFTSDSVIYGPFWKHVLEFWDHRNDSNVLFLKYEDLHKDLKKGVKNVAEFLSQNLSDDQISSIAHRCSFNQMAANPASNHSQWESKIFDSKVSRFMRKGQVGNWKCHLDDEMSKKIDLWIEANSRHSDLKFDYE